MVFKTANIQINTDETAEARTTADGLQNTAISNNTDAITAEACYCGLQNAISIIRMYFRNFS
jgi:hypothetical protein